MTSLIYPLLIPKFEIRISKSETISKFEIIKSKTLRNRVVWNIGPSVIRYCFEFRISCFEIYKDKFSSPNFAVFAPLRETSLFRLRLRRSSGGQAEKLDFLGALGRRENKLLIRNLRRQVPAPDNYRELRLALNLFRGENEFERQRLVPVLDPDLPVNVRCAKREMSGFYARNDARANNKPGRGSLQHLVSGILVEQIRA